MRVLVVMEARAAYGEDDFERFCRDAHPGLVAALAHHCGDRFLAEELAQGALIRCIRALLYAGRPNWDLLATVTPR